VGSTSTWHARHGGAACLRPSVQCTSVHGRGQPVRQTTRCRAYAQLVAQLIVGKHAEAVARSEREVFIAHAIGGLRTEGGYVEPSTGGVVEREGGEDRLLVAAAAVEQLHPGSCLDTTSESMLQLESRGGGRLSERALPGVVNALRESLGRGRKLGAQRRG
jgi:hypothetical protein